LICDYWWDWAKDNGAEGHVPNRADECAYSSLKNQMNSHIHLATKAIMDLEFVATGATGICVTQVPLMMPKICL